MIEADIVVSSTGSQQTVLHAEQIERVMSARRNRPLFMIDIAVPRDIDPAVQHLDNVYLYNIDHLEKLVRENLQHREAELTRCREIIDQRTAALMSKFAPVRKETFEPRTQPQRDWALGGALCPA
jgi:glutamyl-tRNA reductase